jgi:hypothetical protein
LIHAVDESSVQFSSEDNDRPILDRLDGRVPSVDRHAINVFCPGAFARRTRREHAHGASPGEIVVGPCSFGNVDRVGCDTQCRHSLVSADVDPAAVPHQIATGTERVGLDIERAERVGREVVLGGPRRVAIHSHGVVLSLSRRVAGQFPDHPPPRTPRPVRGIRGPTVVPHGGTETRLTLSTIYTFVALCGHERFEVSIAPGHRRSSLREYKRRHEMRLTPRNIC